MSAAVMSARPFSGHYAEPACLFDDHDKPVAFCDVRFDPSGDRTSFNNKQHGQSASVPNKVTVPILKTVSARSSETSHSSQPSVSVTSTPPSSNPPGAFDSSIQWSEADLMYLISCLHPEELMSNQLIFTPSLNALTKAEYPIQLSLYQDTFSTPPPANPFSKHLPIGTGRPNSNTLLAASHAYCPTPSDARRSLAHALLRNSNLISDAIDRYNVLYTLHSLSTTMLHSIRRGMLALATVSEHEWIERLMQLRGFVDDGTFVDGVDESCTVEARLEYYLLEIGKHMLEGWVRSADVALRMGDAERRMYKEVYGDAARFLGRAYGELRV